MFHYLSKNAYFSWLAAERFTIESAIECPLLPSLHLCCLECLVQIFHSVCTDLTYCPCHPACVQLFLSFPVHSEGHRALTVWSSLEQYVWYLLQLSQWGGKSGCSAPSGRRPVTSVTSASLWFAVAHGCWLSLICAKALCTEIIKSRSFAN